MSFILKLTPEAEETFDSLSEQLRQRWGNHFVKKLEDKISQSISLLIINPYIYPIANENTGIRKCVLHKNCSMFYKVHENEIHIAWFWDNRQEPMFI